MEEVETLDKQTRFWNFAPAGEDTVDLRIDGDIVDDGDLWIYEWFGEPASAPNAFRNALAGHSGKNLNVWIDSYGGSVFAATGIYNALQEHKASGGTVTTIGDGKIMSAATVIFMAGDKRKMTPGCMFMMHNPLTSAAGYASDLRKAADVLDVVKECIVNAYQIPTGLDTETISEMMDLETYMSPKTCVKNGFATDILYDSIVQNEVQNIADDFSFNHLAVQNAAGDSIKKFFELAKKQEIATNIPAEPPVSTPKNKEDNKMDLEQLKAENPDLYNQVYNAGVTAERARMQAIEDLAMPGYEAIVNDAKFNSGVTAEALAVAMIKKDKAANAQFLTNRQLDAAPLNQVSATPAPIVDKTQEQLEDELGKEIASMTGGNK